MQKPDFKMFASYAMPQEELARTQPMFEAIARAMEPFRWTEIVTYLESDIDYFSRTIVVEMKNLPGVILKHTLSRDDEMNMYDNPGQFYWDLGVALGAEFKSIPRIEPNDNVCLGEE